MTERRRARAARQGFSFVLHGPDVPVRPHVKALHLLARERARADPAEHRDLAAGLVDRAVAVEAFGERDRGRSGLAPGDEARLRLRAEAVELGLDLGRGELD